MGLTTSDGGIAIPEFRRAELPTHNVLRPGLAGDKIACPTICHNPTLENRAATEVVNSEAPVFADSLYDGVPERENNA